MTKPTKSCAPNEDSDQPGHLIRIFALRLKNPWVLSYPESAQQRLLSDWENAQADLSLLGTQPHCWFCREAAQILGFMPEVSYRSMYRV